MNGEDLTAMRKNQLHNKIRIPENRKAGKKKGIRNTKEDTGNKMGILLSIWIAGWLIGMLAHGMKRNHGTCNMAECKEAGI